MSKSTTAQASSGGLSFGGALCLLFIGLKLGGVINWSWLWVLSPLWIPLVIVLGILGIALLGVLCWAIIQTIAES